MPDIDGAPTRRQFLRATGGAASAAALTGVAEETTASTPERGPRLDVSLTGRVQSLDPVNATDTNSGYVIEQLYDRLTNYPNGEVHSETKLAASYEISEDYTTYRFHLRENARFHDADFGRVTAADVVYSFERLAASPHSSREHYLLEMLGVVHERENGAYVPGSLGVRALDDQTVEIELERPFHTVLGILANTPFAIIPEGIVGDIPGYDGALDYERFSQTHPVGTGPFAFRSRVPEEEVRLDRFGTYYERPARINGVDFRVTPDSPYEGALDGDVEVFSVPDVVYDPARETVSRTDERGRTFGTYELPNGETVKFVRVPTLTTFYVGFDTDNVSRPARKALAYALAQEHDVPDIFTQNSQPAYHFTPPTLYPGAVDAYATHAQEYPYSGEAQLDAAREVMEAAGYSAEHRYSFRFTVYNSDAAVALANRLRERLADAHIDLQVERVGFGDLLRRGRREDLDAYILGWLADWAAPDNFLQLLAPGQGDDANASYFDWNGTAAAERAAAAWATILANRVPTDDARAAREDAYIVMEEANWTDAVAVPLMHREETRYWKQWVDLPPFGSLGPSRQQLTNARTLPEQGTNR